MIDAKYNWNGDRAKAIVFDAAWNNLLAAAVFYWRSVVMALNKPNTGVSKKSGGGQKTERVYPNPSKPGEPPRKITGWLQKHVQYWADKPNMIVRVGLAKNAIYGLFMEMGVAGGKTIVPVHKKTLRWWSEGQQKWIFAKRVRQGRIEARPWLLATLKKVWDQVTLLAGAGQPK